MIPKVAMKFFKEIQKDFVINLSSIGVIFSLWVSCSSHSLRWPLVRYSIGVSRFMMWQLELWLWLKVTSKRNISRSQDVMKRLILIGIR